MFADSATILPALPARRGRLRIYFGACAGIGKTAAMLHAGRALQCAGTDVVIGAVHAHGCDLTAGLCSGLARLDRDGDFDLDLALARRPALLLLDRIACSNHAGARHPKRWQDIDELRDAGIDVFTTASLQDWDSLNDVVTGITGVRIVDTVPDTVFEQADEVMLVDLPVDDVLARLHSAAGYTPPRPPGAGPDYFSRSVLTALRELALRRAADRVEDELAADRHGHANAPLWKTGAALLACIGPHAGAEHLVRSAARIATQMNGPWHAVMVDTPALRRRSAAQREPMLQALQLAQSLGAITALVVADEVPGAVSDYAQRHNLSKVLLGCRPRRWRWPGAPSHLQRIASHHPQLDLIRIGMPQGSVAPRALPSLRLPYWNAQTRRHYLGGALASVITALLALPLTPYLDLANIAMLFTLTVMLVSIRLSRAASIVTTLVGVLAFDFLFVPPRYSLLISDPQYVVTLIVMSVVGLIAGHLTGGLRYQAALAAQRESRTRSLYDFARTLSSALMLEQVFETAESYVVAQLAAHVQLLLPDASGRLGETFASATHRDDGIDAATLTLAQWSYQHARAAGAGTDTHPDSEVLLLPLIAPMCVRGVMLLRLPSREWLLVPELRKQLDTFAALIAIAIERIHYVAVAQDALVRIESERLRNSLLAALSHDLRTPLTSLVGLSESLALSKPALSALQHELAASLRDEAQRMANLVANLLDMARIQSGAVRLNLQWQTVEEVVGTALRANRTQLVHHLVTTQLDEALPLVRFDAVLIERVLCNLLENAVKYTPAGAHLRIAAATADNTLMLDVSDDGPGIPVGQEEIIFDKFTRGERESAKPGVGLGLSICRAIVEAHGGSIRALTSTQGALFRIALPLGTPPLPPQGDDAEAQAMANLMPSAS